VDLGDQAQGYLISKPLPLEKLIEYLTFGQGQNVGEAQKL